MFIYHKHTDGIGTLKLKFWLELTQKYIRLITYNALNHQNSSITHARYIGTVKMHLLCMPDLDSLALVSLLLYLV